VLNTSPLRRNVSGTTNTLLNPDIALEHGCVWRYTAGSSFSRVELLGDLVEMQKHLHQIPIAADTKASWGCLKTASRQRRYKGVGEGVWFF